MSPFEILSRLPPETKSVFHLFLGILPPSIISFVFIPRAYSGILSFFPFIQIADPQKQTQPFWRQTQPVD